LATERSRDARALAEATVVALVHELGEFDAPMILLGGLVPEMLTSGQTPPVPHHLGTNDADILLDFQIAPGIDLSPVERSLYRLGFAPEGIAAGWRWFGMVSGVTMKLEFLCELDDRPAEVVAIATGCTTLGAMNLRGTGYVREDWRVVNLTGTLPNGNAVSVPVRVAGLGGYLLAKATALRNRSKDKDYYDFVYVLLYNREGGPAQAANTLRNSALGSRLPSLGTLWREIQDRFADPGRAGALAYARQALIAHPDSDIAILRQDAVGAGSDFIDAIDRGSFPPPPASSSGSGW